MMIAAAFAAALSVCVVLCCSCVFIGVDFTATVLMLMRNWLQSLGFCYFFGVCERCLSVIVVTKLDDSIGSITPSPPRTVVSAAVSINAGLGAALSL